MSVGTDVPEELVEIGRGAINTMDATHLAKASEGHPWAESEIAHAVLSAASEAGWVRLPPNPEPYTVDMLIHAVVNSWNEAVLELAESKRHAKALAGALEMVGFRNPPDALRAYRKSEEAVHAA